jgi:VWFA-related protein
MKRKTTNLLSAVLVLVTFAGVAAAQQQPPAASTGGTQTPSSSTPPSAENVPEIISQEELPTFKVKVNLVEVRAVVRDAKGHVVDNLKVNDFQLFDNGKPQVITKFSIDRATDRPTIHSEPAVTSPNAPAPDAASQPPMARGFFAYLFDDEHLNPSDLAQARNAAVKHLQSLGPEERAGVFTTSGVGQLDFTDDRAQLTAAMNRIMSRIKESQASDCPPITYYQADLILNKNDPLVEQALMQATLACTLIASGPSDSSSVQRGTNSKISMMVFDAARRELEIGDTQVRLVLSTIQMLVRRMAELPGQRTVVLVSPGFFVNSNGDLPWRATEVMERAVNFKVVINTLDARGLYTRMPNGNESQQSKNPLLQYDFAEQDVKQDVLADIAGATGGTFFHNNNDFAEGFRQLAAPPHVSYLLGFAPQNVKPDGSFHNLKVKLTPPAEGSVRARKGYFAPKGATDATEQAKMAISDAVFSQDEVREIPVELHTQFFKSDDDNAKLSVLARVDVKQIHFHKANGRNNNDVTIVAALFDRNGNFVAGNQKLVQLHLKDATLENRLGSGISLKSSFDVKPGSYVVRLVVRDTEGQMAARNLAVQIP